MAPNSPKATQQLGFEAGAPSRPQLFTTRPQGDPIPRVPFRGPGPLLYRRAEVGQSPRVTYGRSRNESRRP